LPATNLGLQKRGFLKVGHYADIVLFDPLKINDHATFEEPLQFSTGVAHVMVNGVLAIENEIHTGAFPGQFIKGSGALE
jgi:N-acyl-D-amino-acid deacylase